MKTQHREHCNKTRSEHTVDTLRGFGGNMSFFRGGADF